VGDKVQCVDEKVQVVIDGARPVWSGCRILLTSIFLDGEQARVTAKEIGDKVAEVGIKVQCVDEKVQVAIDGAQGLSSQLLNHSNIYTSRQQSSKSSDNGY
jgi:hypothetical protein